jgi:methyl-accepting chemotaxis protein
MFRPSNVRVSYKIAALGAAGILGLLLIGIIFHFGAASQSHFQKLADDALAVRSTTRTLLIELLQLRRNEKDFLLRKDDKYTRTHAENTAAAVGMFDQLKLQVVALDQN